MIVAVRAHAVSGSFDHVDGPPLAGGLVMTVDYESQRVILAVRARPISSSGRKPGSAAPTGGPGNGAETNDLHR
jgi:hypothetical protein